ncbi:MAG: hypothetical protein U1F54_23095 [Burkholderiales bacterium]
MPGPFHLPIRYPVNECAIAVPPFDPANLARYGAAREHPGAPPPRPDERPWIGKAKGRKRK